MNIKRLIMPAVLATGVAVGFGVLGAQAMCENGQNRGSGMGQGYGHGGGQGMMHGWKRRGMGQGAGQGRGFGMKRFGMGQGGGQGHQGNRVRHRVVRHGGGVPAPYTNYRNPVKPTPKTIADGKKLYAENCASCHGVNGAGDGEAGKSLNPKPANLAFIMDKWIATDAFLFWTISEGGEKLKTAMPAFKDSLSKQERWSVIHFLRSKANR